jgi:alpha-tubulin suppressor-like RCC1 family protein
VANAGWATLIRFSAGTSHLCALKDNGNVNCFGSNLYGQLGFGIDYIANTPYVQTVAGLSNARSISAGAPGNHMCVVMQDNTAKCWGQNLYG